MRVEAHGCSIDVPEAWEVRIFRRPGAAPVLHVATFALNDRDGDFGAAATGRMRPDDVFAALVEYRADGKVRPGEGLFAPGERPRAPRAHELSPTQLQVGRRGQLGCQRFFTDRGRACCLYVVVQPARKRPERLLNELGNVLATLRFQGPGAAA